MVDRINDENSSMNRLNSKTIKQNLLRTDEELLRDVATRCHSLLCGKLEIASHSLPLRGVTSRSTANTRSDVKFGSGKGELLKMSFL